MKKRFFKVLLLLPVIALAHFLAFPQETRCMLIRFANFEKTSNIYFRKNVSSEKIAEIQRLQSAAENKVKDFWSDSTGISYALIFCSDEKDYNRYGVAGTPAATNFKGGPFVVVSNDGLDSSVLAHEIAHAVLYNNIGWYKNQFKIPAWFSEGLAMQVDDRHYYSIDSFLCSKNKGINIPDVTLLRKATDFFTGDTETVMLHYSAAKYLVHEWLKTHSIKLFVERIKKGSSFEKAYGEKD